MNQIYNIDAIWEYDYFGDYRHFEGKILINDEVMHSVDNDEWREMFYGSLTTPDEIAEHIAYNMIVNDAGLSMLDGFANFPDEYAQIIGRI